ncbi:MAG: hypothetical protein HOO96_08540 [Polyangiaceae bacterium]|nr:hypothetical protein [Polyangiaceae bacterium]
MSSPVSSAVRLVRVILFAVLALVVPRIALAQTVTIPDNGYTRANGDGKTASDRNNIKPDVITYDDCANDRGYNIVVNTTAYDQTSELQLWAGTQDCTNVTVRSGSTQQCWRAFPGAVPRVASSTINVKVRDILSYAKTQPDYVKAGEDVCAKAAQANITLYYIFVKGGEAAGTGANKVFTVDTVGPPAPTNLTTGIGEKLLVVSWKPSSETTDTQSYNVYCDDGTLPATDASTPVDGSTTADAGVDSGIDAGDDGGDAQAFSASSSGVSTQANTSGTCSSAALIEGTVPPTSIKPCGTVSGPAATSATVTDRVNGVTYAVAVSAVDQYGNPGPLSTITCATPAPTDDFFDLYRRSGGSAGGCNEAGNGSVSALVVLGAIALAAFVRRRRA